ncbi:MAG: hypothetical protein PHC88_03850 [Terrimicrobiaceae bacterium]|nr:hypothetical protein [Terrimicrobiaceae bacterium]
MRTLHLAFLFAATSAALVFGGCVNVRHEPEPSTTTTTTTSTLRPAVSPSTTTVERTTTY